jgi:hypothetical protein
MSLRTVFGAWPPQTMTLLIVWAIKTLLNQQRINKRISWSLEPELGAVRHETALADSHVCAKRGVTCSDLPVHHVTSLPFARQLECTLITPTLRLDASTFGVKWRADNRTTFLCLSRRVLCHKLLYQRTVTSDKICLVPLNNNLGYCASRLLFVEVLFPYTHDNYRNQTFEVNARKNGINCSNT